MKLKPIFLERTQPLTLFPSIQGLFWVVKLRDIDNAEARQAQDFLDQATKEYLSELNFEEDKKRAFVTHAALQFYLNDYLQETPCIRRNIFGKPYLTGGQLQFNLSHAKDWAFFGFHVLPIGVDIESIHTPLIEDFWVKASEKQLLADLPLIYLWCAKEALLKGEGTGFSGSLPVFNKVRHLNNDAHLFEAGTKQVWVYPNQIDQHVLAICIHEEHQ